MDFIKQVIDIILHLDKFLGSIISSYGALTYLLLFLIVFCETGLVVIPFLPGDSMLFAAGAFAALGSLNIYMMILILAAAAILGDTVNYHIGKFIGPKVLNDNNVKFLKKEYLDKTHSFYEKYGGKAIILARFIPIVRTFAPFVAGIGKMDYFKFISFNAMGGFLWVTLFSFGGYYFGNLPAVRKNFSLVIFVIIIISILPAVIEYFRQRFKVEKEV